jgi:hypothetical protein
MTDKQKTGRIKVRDDKERLVMPAFLFSLVLPGCFDAPAVLFCKKTGFFIYSIFVEIISIPAHDTNK